MVVMLLITGDGSWNKRAIKARGKDEIAETLNLEDGC